MSSSGFGKSGRGYSFVDGGIGMLRMLVVVYGRNHPSRITASSSHTGIQYRGSVGRGTFDAGPLNNNVIAIGIVVVVIVVVVGICRRTTTVVCLNRRGKVGFW